MDNSWKLSKLKQLLKTDAADMPDDDVLGTYLDLAAFEILNYLFSVKGEIPTGTSVPDKYAVIQIAACVAGYGISGAEGQTTHSENGIVRSFKYADMVDYIHAHIVPYIGVV